MSRPTKLPKFKLVSVPIDVFMCKEPFRWYSTEPNTTPNEKKVCLALESDLNEAKSIPSFYQIPSDHYQLITKVYNEFIIYLQNLIKSDENDDENQQGHRIKWIELLEEQINRIPK